MTLTEHEENPVQTETPERLLAFEFTGRGGEYFRIWVVNIVLSIITLGIYSAWAKVRTKRYFYGNTRLDGSAFAYHATPLMVLKGRLVAVAALVAYIVLDIFYPLAGGALYGVILLALPWAVWKSVGFNARMSSYRNVRFAFRAPLGKAYIALLLLPLALGVLIALPVLGVFAGYAFEFSSFESAGDEGFEQGIAAALALGALMLPLGVLGLGLIHKVWASYYVNHHRFGQGRFAVTLSFARYLVIYLKMFIVPALVIVLLFLVALFAMDEDAWGAFGWLLFGAFFITGIWVSAYLQTRLRNYIYSRATLEPSIALSSRLAAHRLFWLYFSNTALLIITLGVAYPWARVRVARYLVDTLGARFRGDDLDAFVSQLQPSQSALGEELGEAFDFDVGLGV